MSSKSNNQGRAYEYAFIMCLADTISPIRSVNIIQNASLEACFKAWETLSEEIKNIYKLSSAAAVVNLFNLEPRILENKSDIVTLLLQSDKKGEEGDVRDILIIRSSIQWEIGLSMKHNHFAVKHSRLASSLDFGKSWFDIPCSKEYWTDVKPIFSYLQEEKQKETLFNSIENKERSIYLPILNAFGKEVRRIFSKDSKAPAKLVEYLLGKYDFYKIISVDSKEYTSIQAMNLHGTLNNSSDNEKPSYFIPKVKLPTRIIHMGLIPGSGTTIELYLDEGWQFTFRIHNASKYVEPSLKFDIQIVGMPTAVITLNCKWV